MSSEREPASSDRCDAGLPGPSPDERPQPDGRRNAEGVRVDPDAEAERERRTGVVSALVDHEPGVLSRVSGLFARRQFNIESLSVGPTTVDGHARLTLVVEETDAGIEQVEKQLAKLRHVVAVGELDDDAVGSELAVVKVRGDRPEEVRAVTRMYDGRTRHAGPDTVTVELTGDSAEIDDALDAFGRFGVVEVARTGRTALARGETPTTPGERPGDETSGSDSAADETHADDGSTDETNADGANADETPNGRQ